jgi:hypothetical protein
VYLPPRMDWVLARERLGAELIGARERVAQRFRLAVRDRGQTVWALAMNAEELVLLAGAALADGMPPETPWRKCGGLLRIDASDRGELAQELTVLWRCMVTQLSRASLNVEEDSRMRELLAAQLEASLRGAAAEHWAARGIEVGDSLRYGGLTAICTRPLDPAATHRAA